MSVFIAVVSHGHADLIKKLGTLKCLAKEFNVVVKNNKPEDIESYCKENGISLIDKSYGLGFGENNNCIFEYCSSDLGMKESDHFICLNPDVKVGNDQISKLIELMILDNIKIAGINLYKDSNYTVYDNSVRDFPQFFDFASSYLSKENKTIIDKRKIVNPKKVGWIAGSFLAFRASHFENLLGFNERFFMYCEDIDICYRSNEINEPITYFPNIKALHLAQHSNRKLFSMHFLWHVKSILIYCFGKKLKVKSRLEKNG